MEEDTSLQDYLNEYYEEFEANSSSSEEWSEEEEEEEEDTIVVDSTTLQQQQPLHSTTTTTTLQQPLLQQQISSNMTIIENQFKWIELLFQMIKGSIPYQPLDDYYPIPHFFKQFLQDYSTLFVTLIQESTKYTNQVYLDCIYYTFSNYRQDRRGPALEKG